MRSIVVSIVLACMLSAAQAGAETPITAVLATDKGGQIHAACRPWLEGVIAGAGWKLRPVKTDPVEADVVFTVKLHVHGQGPRRGAALEVSAFETASAARVAAAAELGRPAKGESSAIDQVCKSVADQLPGQLDAWNQRVAKQGMPIRLSFRFDPAIEPGPQTEISAFLKAAGVKAQPSLSSQRQVSYLIRTQQAPDAFRTRLEAFLHQRWKSRQGPPSSLPGNPRSLVYGLEMLK